MKIFVIDDEKNALEYLTDKVMEVCPDADVQCFQKAQEALERAKEEAFDVAFLDIQMPKINGIALAKKFKEINPKSNIIFVTGYSEYTMDAFSLDASGYLLKPASSQQVQHALDNLRYPVAKAEKGMLTVQCFGNFEVYYNGEPLRFKYAKTKEMLAYLIDRNGANCTLDEICVALWEDDDNHKSYLRSMQKDLLDVLGEIGCKDIFAKQRGAGAIIKSRIACDYFDWLDGKPSGINAYHGEYMSQYSWAENTAALLFDDYYDED